MQLQKLTVYRVRIPFKQSFKHASAERFFAENLIVRCESSDGIAGWGETIAREYVTGESTESVIERYKAVPARIWQTPIVHPTDIEIVLDKAGLKDCHVARCGIEIALLDMLSAAMAKPLYEYLNTSWPELAKVCNRGPFWYGGAIGLASPLKTAVSALKMKLYRFKKVKLKLEKNLKQDQMRLKIVRAILGSKIDLRVDANEAWDMNYADAIVPALRAAGVSSVEQPFPKDNVDLNALFRSKHRFSVILDESACSLADAQRASQKNYADVLCIKLPKTGGFFNALSMIDFAQKNNMFIQLSCQVGESAILSAAGRHMAALCGNIRYLEGSFDRYLLKDNVSREDISFGFGGKAEILTQPGLGITVDTGKVEELATETIAIIS
ncbi:MAG: enolase C-terminal domain-like protein [Candidatus Auribacterota bacterium]